PESGRRARRPDSVFREAQHSAGAGIDVDLRPHDRHGGPAMVKSAYSSGKPAYGVGAGNATVVVDETANIEEAARNTRISKIHNNGSGCSCDGNLIIEETIDDKMLAQLQKEGGYLCNAEEKEKLRKVMWDDENHRIVDTVARYAKVIADKAG